MNRILYLIGWGYVLIAGALVVREREPDLRPLVHSLPAVRYTTDAGAWFARIRARCNPLEIDLALRNSQPPAGWEGDAYAAACEAVAGRIDAARTRLLALDAPERHRAAGIVFEVAHPIADAGDDRSAGPIMQLVAEFQPTNYMALYHAGMSYYILGEAELAKRHLGAFLEQYNADDGWRANAREVLGRLER